MEGRRPLDQQAALLGMGAGRVQGAHRTRKLAHLQKELHGEALQPGAIDPAILDAQPEGMGAKAATRVDEVTQGVGEVPGFEGGAHTHPRVVQHVGVGRSPRV